MVDEYQDVSLVQDMIIRAVSAGGRRLFMVGDVKQSIYRFRLADPTIFLGKYEKYADVPCRRGEPGRVFLRESFRSRPEVVDAVNAVFGCLMSKGLGEMDYDERARPARGWNTPASCLCRSLSRCRCPRQRRTRSARTSWRRRRPTPRA